jgi:hypothetical protein
MPIQVPNTNIFTLAEVQDLVMQEVLRRNGIADASTHAVRYQSAFRMDAGVMAITVISCDEIPPAKAEPEVPLNLKGAK